MPTYNQNPIIYAVSVAKSSGVNGVGTIGTGPLKYATVQRQSIGTVSYVIKNRMGVELVVDEDSVHELIAALQQAVKPIY